MCSKFNSKLMGEICIFVIFLFYDAVQDVGGRLEMVLLRERHRP